MLSQALKSLASSSIATYQHVLEPFGLWSPVKASLILNSAHLEIGVTALNWWVWSTKVGVSAKFLCVLCTHIIKHPPLLIPGYALALHRQSSILRLHMHT